MEPRAAEYLLRRSYIPGSQRSVFGDRSVSGGRLSTTTTEGVQASGVYVVAFKHGGGVQAWSALKAGVRISSIVCFFVLFPFVPFFSTLLRINERTSKCITPSQVSQYLPHLLSL